MNRVKKELRKAGIIFEPDEIDIIMKGPEYDTSERLVTITNDIIVTVRYSAVLDPAFILYDRRSFEPIGQQVLYKDNDFFGTKAKNPWLVGFYE